MLRTAPVRRERALPPPAAAPEHRVARPYAAACGGCLAEPRRAAKRARFAKRSEVMTHSLRKAIVPVAGLGTRFLPATKSSPKEMLPIVDKPLVQYAVEEAVAAGVTEIIFVTSRAKRAIEDHFDSGPELEALLQVNGKHSLLDGLRRLFPPHVRYAYVRSSSHWYRSSRGAGQSRSTPGCELRPAAEGRFVMLDI
jgi:hypothetical protein